MLCNRFFDGIHWSHGDCRFDSGRGCAFSAIPVFVFEGSITLLAGLLSPVMTELALAYLSLVGSLLIFCIGVNLIWGKKVSVANMLPSVLLAVLAAYLPWEFYG